MWSKSFNKTYQGVKKESVWQTWADVEGWPKWDTELECCELKGQFEPGNYFTLQPKGGPRFTLWLSEVVPNVKFTDYCKFFGATMYDEHLIEEVPGGVRITNTIRVSGPLAFFWARLVAKKVSDSIAEQTGNLIHYARSTYG